MTELVVHARYVNALESRLFEFGVSERETASMLQDAMDGCDGWMR